MTSPSPSILGVLLAGGRSKRMGSGDKCLEVLAGRPLIAHAIERLGPQVDRLVINANGDPQRFAQFDLPVVADTIDEFPGPLAGILAGMRWATQHSPQSRFIASVATDTPFFPRNLVARLLKAIGENDEMAIVRSGERHYPVFGLFPIALAEDLDLFLRDASNLSVMAWIDRQHCAFAAFDPPEDIAVDPFLNINTPEELAAAEKVIGIAGSGGADVI